MLDDQGPASAEQEERPRPRVVDKRVSARTEPSAEPSPTPPGGPPGTEATPGSPPGEAGADPSGAGPQAAAQSASSDPGDAPVGGRLSGRAPADPSPGSGVWTPEQEAEARRFADEVEAVPATDWLANAAITLVNVAAVKLERGHLADAQLAIDALSGILNETGTRLGDVETPLRQTLAQLQLAYAQKVQPPPS